MMLAPMLELLTTALGGAPAIDMEGGSVLCMASEPLLFRFVIFAG